MKHLLTIYKLSDDFGVHCMIRFVLFEFRTNLASHNAIYTDHSYDYAFSDDRTNCLARFALNLEPFMNYAS